MDIGPPADGPFVVHDPLCPLVPAAFIASLVERTAATGLRHVAVRPVTDTIKVLEGGIVGETVDRETMLQLASPAVLPGGTDPGVVSVLAALVTSDTVFVVAPPIARRVMDDSDLRLLSALADEPLR